MLFPIPIFFKDGGTREYRALLYKVTIFNTFTFIEDGNHLEPAQKEGVMVELLGKKIFDNVHVVKNTYTQKCYLTAFVLTASDSNALIVPCEQNREPDFNNQIYLSFDYLELDVNPKAGDIVKITYDGLTLETYPSQICKIYNIEIVEEHNTFRSAFDAKTSFANWSDDENIVQFAENKDFILSSNGRYLPIYKLDKLEDLNWFKETFKDVFSMASRYDEIPSFNEITSTYDSTFFNKNTLLLVYVTANSGSDRFALDKIVGGGSTLCIDVKQLDTPDAGTCDMAGWFITVAVPDDVINQYTNFNAF